MFRKSNLVDRLAEFRESLGLNKTEMADRLGLKQRAYNFYEAGQRKLNPEILDKLSGLGLNLNWLTTGEGSMTLPANNGQAHRLNVGENAETYGTAAVTPGFPEREIVRAQELASKALGPITLSPTKMGWLVATIAEMLVRGRAEEEILEEASPMAKALAYSGSGSQSPGNPSQPPGGRIP